MDSETFEIPTKLEVHPVGENGEIEIVPTSPDKLLSTSYLPCGIPSALPNTTEKLESFLEDLESLPIFHFDAVQKYIPVKPDISSLYSIDLCPLQTELSVKRNMMTGKILGFTEVVKDSSSGTHDTSTSLSRAPGPPDAGVRGSTSSFPFWPGGMDEPWVDVLKKGSINTSLFEGEFLDTPPGFERGMKFERKTYDQIDYAHQQPQKVSLSDVFSMDDSIDIDIQNASEEHLSEIDLEKAQTVKNSEESIEGAEVEESLIKITSLPVLNISETDLKKPTVHYEWAVIENVANPVTDFEERIPDMARKWPFELDIFQKRAILHVEKRESVFVAAHTSAGKTVVAEYAIALSKKNLTKVVYTSPIKALSNQKYRDFKETFEDVGLITGDIQINPTAKCLIMTTEILRSMLYHGSDTIRELEWVVFDEVHYINDSERGFVWEEVFIMLPDHVNLIMLSATVPNTAEFAEWLGGIKKRKIYVISTLKRPVPLVYYLYTGSVGKTENEIFPIVDEHRRFLNDKYTEALNVRKAKESKSKTSTGPKGPKYNITPLQEKNVYIGMLGYLQKNNLLPAVCFTFSRKKCNAHAEMLMSKDLTTQEEKNKIVKKFRDSVSTLKKEDRDLPQVRMMAEHLKRGFGIHHSGILPILKEVIEMLFQESLVKVLFATETFAMGVNMPARTVVFDSIRKHDGLHFRDLEPSEFIQMAGRAGRRGLDKTGTVIVLCKADIPEAASLHNMMLGQPTKLRSQFRLTYNMILNLLKIRTLRVEDVMKRSFGECDSQKERKKFQDLLNSATERFSHISKLECSICNHNDNLEQYIKTVKETKALKEEIMPKLCAQFISSKSLVPGRVLALSVDNRQNVPAILLSVEKDKKCKVLVISEKKENGDNPSGTTHEISRSPWTKKLFFPSEKQPEVSVITFKDVEVISDKLIRIEEKEILKEWRNMQLVKANPGHCISSAFQELCSLSEANLNGFSSLNTNLKDIDTIDQICRLQNLERCLSSSICTKCPDFSNHFTELSEFMQLQEEITDYKYKISEKSLTLHPEYEMRKNVLRTLGYIDDEDNVQLKGSVAREISNHELLITELLVKSVFKDCEPEEIAALLSCMVFQQRCDEDLELPSHLKEKVFAIKEVATDISLVQSSNGIIEPNFVEQYNFHLVNVVYEWAKGTKFAEIMQCTEIDEGIIVRSIQRLSELLKDVRNGASLVGDTVLATKMINASHKIKRDIVFAASLYTQ